MIIPKRSYRLNQQITAREVRLIDEAGRQVGIVLKDDALREAQKKQLDLVEIAPKANPPVAKLADFKKFLYLEEKKRRAEKKKSGEQEIKEIRFGPFTGEHDLKVRVERAKAFLKAGHRIKIVVKFTGRQMAHPAFGHKILEDFLSQISALSKLEREPHFEGRFLWTIVSPGKEQKKEKVSKDETENEKSSR